MTKLDLAPAVRRSVRNLKRKGAKDTSVRGRPAEPLKIFVSYCHKDEVLRLELAKHLAPLERTGLLRVWHDRRIDPGAEWEKEIASELESADIVLLLVSADFISSRYCYEAEMDRALHLHDEGSVVVIPVILRSCVWNHAPFAKLQALPRDGKAARSWDDLDEALTNIAQGIKAIAEKRYARRS